MRKSGKPVEDQKKETPVAAEQMAGRQREISVSEFFLKNRHLLGFDNPRKALLTAVKEAVDNSLDACEEAGILPEIKVEITQTGESRFRVEVTDNGPGVVRAQIPKIFAKLLYGSKFHRLRMSRGQQGIGISAAVMYGQLTTGNGTRILSRIQKSRSARIVEVHIDTRKNNPAILKDDELEWNPVFPAAACADGRKTPDPTESKHGTSVTIEMEAAYVRGRLSVDEYLRQCAIANPHLRLHYRIILAPKAAKNVENAAPPDVAAPQEHAQVPTQEQGAWATFERSVNSIPEQPREIKPHPHGVELGMLMQMLKDTGARTLKGALSEDFSRVSAQTAVEICTRAGLDPKANPVRIAHREAESLYNAIAQTKIMRPPTDCLAPIGEEQLLSGLKKEIEADFYTAVTRQPTVYRGNPFQIEAALAYVKAPKDEDLGADEPARVMRFANRAPLLAMAGGCAITKAVSSVNWRNYGLAQPRGSLPLGPVIIVVHMASVWVPFTSESKEAVAHYEEILNEITLAVQECGRQLSVFLSRQRRQAEVQRKHDYISLYIPHLALGLKQVLMLSDKQESLVVGKLRKILERTHLDA